MFIFPFIKGIVLLRGKVLDIHENSMTAPNLKGVHWNVFPNHGTSLLSLFSPLWIYLLPQILPENYLSGRNLVISHHGSNGGKEA